MSSSTVVITDHDFESLDIEMSILEDVGEVRDVSGISGSDFNTVVAEADGVLNLRRNLNTRLIERMDECRIVARYGIGVDNIDIDAAAKEGIYVTNVPDYCIEEVSIHALALLLAIDRGIPQYNKSIANGKWDRSVATPLHRLSTETVGIVGFGDIGRSFARRLNALNVSISASDPFLDPEDVADEPGSLVSFNSLLSESDYVSIHSPLTEDTRGLFDAEAFNTMKDDAVIINVARGAIVDEKALLEALENRRLRGAALDVFDPEPPEADSPLRDHPQIVTTPHVAWYSEEANIERRRVAAECVRTALQGSTPDNVVVGPSDRE